MLSSKKVGDLHLLSIFQGKQIDTVNKTWYTIKN